MKTLLTELTEDQIEELKKELVPKGKPVRFLKDGCSVDIITGHKLPKGTNVFNQYVYWHFTEEVSGRIAELLGVKAVY